MVTPADIDRARQRIKSAAVRTPTLTSPTLDARTGAQVFLKAESLQRTGSFKFRGAFNALAALDEDARARGVVTHSSGNHAQAIACAAQIHGVDAAIVMPEDAPASKVAATEAFGAEIVRYDRYREDRAARGRALAEERGATLVPPYDHPDVIAGQGTVAAELCEDAGPLDALVVCVGGGGLISGCAVAATARFPAVRVIGVEPEAGDDTRRSLIAGHRVEIDVPRTIADGQQLTIPGEMTFPIVQRLVEDVVTVTDAQIVAAMAFAAERCKLVLEPSGACALAALLSGAVDLAGKRVGVTLTGGNVDRSRYLSLLAEAPQDP